MVDTFPEPLPPPSPQLLQEGNDTLHTLQLILANLGKDERRKGTAFKRIVAKYKRLGAALHEARKRVPPPEPLPAADHSTARFVAALEHARHVEVEDAHGISALEHARHVEVEESHGVAALEHARHVEVEAQHAASALEHARPVTVGRPHVVSALGKAARLSAHLQHQQLAGDGASGRARPAREPRAARPDASDPDLPSGTTVAQPEDIGPEDLEKTMETLAQLPLEMPRFTSTLGPAGPRIVSDGPEVARLQQLLGVLGYELEVTGEFDIHTLRAVHDFQMAHGIKIDTRVGVEMRKLLNEMVTG